MKLKRIVTLDTFQPLPLLAGRYSICTGSSRNLVTFFGGQKAQRNYFPFLPKIRFPLLAAQLTSGQRKQPTVGRIVSSVMPPEDQVHQKKKEKSSGHTVYTGIMPLRIIAKKFMGFVKSLFLKQLEQYQSLSRPNINTLSYRVSIRYMTVPLFSGL